MIKVVFNELVEALKQSLREGSFRSGQLLSQIRDEKLYGHWGTFEDLILGELRISVQQGYRLIFAFEVSELIKKNRLNPPLNERQLRPLRPLSDDDKLIAWERACQKKQFGQPTYIDVQREVNAMHKKSDGVVDRSYRIYRKHLQKARTDLGRGWRILEAGDLDLFLGLLDKETKKHKERVRRMYDSLFAEIRAHAIKWDNPLDSEEATLKQKQPVPKLLIPVLGMLGSAHAGERDNAALQATRIMKEAGLTWEDIL